MFEKFFKLEENGTNIRTEVIAGVTTFMTMVYILAVNPNILGDPFGSAMDAGAVFTATAVASAIACFCMAAFANKPFALSAGLGLNAYFSYTVVGAMGYPWQVALTAVLVEGLIFIVLSVTNVREAIFNAIPSQLKIAVSVGIGFFIAFIGLQNAGLIVDSATLVGLFSVKDSMGAGTFNSAGVSVLLALAGTVVIALLFVKGVKGYMLYGILITWILGMICELLGVYQPDIEAGLFSTIPHAVVAAPASLAPTLMQFDFKFVATHFLDFVVVVFAFLFVDLFDTLGTVIGCASKADMLDEDGKLPGIRGVLLADAVGTTVGAALGTSTITTFVESSSGITEGGRTGLTTCVTGVLFLVALFLSPLFLTIPSFATAPALIFVGYLMMQQVGKIDWEDVDESIPCFICIIMMALSYSISDGIAFGVISYVVLHALTRRQKECSPLMYVLAVLFVLKYFIL